MLSCSAAKVTYIRTAIELSVNNESTYGNEPVIEICFLAILTLPRAGSCKHQYERLDLGTRPDKISIYFPTFVYKRNLT